MRRSVPLLVLVLSTLAAGLWARPAQAQSGPCAPPIVNPIACENTKPGNPQSEWDLPGKDAGDPSIQGFSTDISVNLGETISFKVKTTANPYRIDIYRLGWYGGQGARKVATVQPSVSLPQNQPACLRNSSVGLIDCGNWVVSASWPVPATAVSGIYIGRLVRTDTGGASHIPFIVRDDNGHSDLLFQASDTTWLAYSTYGGASFYRDTTFGSAAGRAYKVSFNRPLVTRTGIDGIRSEDASWLFDAEYPLVRWLERNGYNVSYFTGTDSDRRGAEIKEHKVFLSVGHDEYWSGQQRTNVEAARDAGVHLAFLSGNEVFWKTRWENSTEGSNTPYRTLVSYKETHANAKIDPTPAWTGTWRDPRFSPPADGGRPENGLTGTIFTVNGPRNDTITVPAADGKLRLWRNTSIATLSAGQTATLTAGTLGYEWDEDLDNGFRPAGLFQLSSTTIAVSSYIQDFGSTYGNGTATHSLTMYRHAGGALVFGAGTTRWAWGLDGTHDGGPTIPDARMQQAMVNLFADISVQPVTLTSGLVVAAKSTDAIPPISQITSPSNGSSLPGNTAVTITGTASDAGGVVGGVEVSADGGSTWHRANGRESWNFSWTPTTVGAVTLKSRAVDDSGNIETPAAGVAVTVTSATVTFDDLSSPDRYLNGQYPAGQVDWGTNTWWLSSPWRKLTTNSVSYPTGGVTSATFTFVSPKRLVSLQAFNGGTGSTTVTLSCSGNPTKTQSVGANTLTTIGTGWTQACSAVTVGSSNGWDTNFDSLFYDLGIPDTTAPVISNVQATNVTSTGATIIWTTDEPATSQVLYSTDTSYTLSTTQTGTRQTSHAVQLTGLTAGTLYHSKVRSVDAATNTATSTDFTFTTTTPDTTPPVITAVLTNGITSNSATISWTTNEPATSQVKYGTTQSYGSLTPLDSAKVTGHSVTLTGLAPNTSYFYRVVSADASGNSTEVGDATNTFTTAAATAQTVTFDDKSGQNQALNGQYPANVINWGTNIWWHSSAWGLLTTKSISFYSGGQTSATFTFITARRLMRLDAYNGGVATTVTITCNGQTRTVSLGAGQLLTIDTGFTLVCTTVTVSSTNGWDTNFDNLVHDGG